MKVKNYVNYWELAIEYAESKIKLEIGISTQADYDYQINIKEGYEAGFLKAVELFITNNKLMIETFNIKTNEKI